MGLKYGQLRCSQCPPDDGRDPTGLIMDIVTGIDHVAESLELLVAHGRAVGGLLRIVACSSAGMAIHRPMTGRSPLLVPSRLSLRVVTVGAFNVGEPLFDRL